MINEFFELNKKAIRAGLKWMSIIGISFVIIMFIIAYSTKGQLPDLSLSIIIILSAGIGFPIFGTTVGFLKWWADIKSSRKSFSYTPFCELEKIGFQNVRLNQNSKSKFIKEIYRGELNGFIIDIEPGNREEAKSLQFRFSLKPTDIDNDFNIEDFNYPEIKSGFSSIMTSYHRVNNNLKSIGQLKNELIEITDMLNKKTN
ncbi:hypothetical protein N9242_06545 [Vicingaceae bacterium]|nr:hypothetical protein [Vicingaceae bacterium]